VEHPASLRRRVLALSALPANLVMTYVDLRPDDVRPVQVLHEGRWVDGDLEVYRRLEGRWDGFVRYSTGFAETRIDWFEEGAVRPAG